MYFAKALFLEHALEHIGEKEANISLRSRNKESTRSIKYIEIEYNKTVIYVPILFQMKAFHTYLYIPYLPKYIDFRLYVLIYYEMLGSSISTRLFRTTATAATVPSLFLRYIFLILLCY